MHCHVVVVFAKDMLEWVGWWCAIFCLSCCEEVGFVPYACIWEGTFWMQKS
jgi:hypothetical protein